MEIRVKHILFGQQVCVCWSVKSVFVKKFVCVFMWACMFIWTIF